MMNHRTPLIAGVAIALALLATKPAKAQFAFPSPCMPSYHLGVGVGYFGGMGCGCYGSCTCFGPIGWGGPMWFPPPPTLIVGGPIAPVFQPWPAAAIGPPLVNLRPAVPAAAFPVAGMANGGVPNARPLNARPLNAQPLNAGLGDDPFAPLGAAPENQRPRLAGRPRPAEPMDEIRRRVDALKRSTPQGRERADRSLAAGDASFADGVYGRATSRYREAIARAPDYAEAHFRLAHAYVATKRFNLALKSALTALELAGTGRRDGFSLAELYRGNKFARQQHDDDLLDASLREPDDGGLQFLLGLTWHFGGNPLKAREHFELAARLPGAQQAYARHFLPVADVNEPEPDDVAGN